MPFDTWLAFFVAVQLISLSPGAGALSCMSAGTRYGHARAFRNILGLQLGILFMLAVLPQFIDPARPQLIQYAICAATMFFIDLVVMSGYTGFAARVLRGLRAPHHLRQINRAFGGLFVAAGLFLATFRRAA
jgi:threonine/homoserine/homoserine lactone efflux protein